MASASAPEAEPTSRPARRTRPAEPGAVSTEGEVSVSVLVPRAPSSASAEPSAVTPTAAPSGEPDSSVFARVSSQLDAQTGPALSAAEAAWIPFRALREVHSATRELPAPAGLSLRGGRMLWSLVANARTLDTPAARAALCEAVTRAEPRVECSADALTVGADERTRIALGWRVEAPSPQNPRYSPDLATPLRALALSATPNTCVRSVQRTPRSLEVELCAPDARALGLTLALLTVAPGLSDAVLLRSEPDTCGLHVHVAWPLDRARVEGVAELGDEPWPARCGEHSTLAADLPPGTVPDAISRIDGTRAHGAVVRVLDRAYLATEGDHVAGFTITSISPRGVFVVRDPSPGARAARSRPRPLLRPFPTASSTPAPRGQGIRIPLPPEPPAVPSPRGAL